MPYDLFISYSRRDNQHGRISQFVDRIRTDFADFANRDLVAFFDQTEIQGMQDWRQRILQGLRESRLLLACLSPTYLKSEYCEWEFVEYLKYEIGHLRGFNGVAPVYFVQVTGWDDNDFDKHCATWIAEFRRRQNFDLRPWYEQGESALREAAVQERMGKLNSQIAWTITRSERAEKSLGNVDAHNPHFIGRTSNLRMLRENFVTPGHIGVVTAVNGIGGLGKTALAIEYSHAFADEYGGGRWQVRCEGNDDLRLALAELATPIGFEFTDDEKKNPDLQFDRTRRELKKLADAREPHRCLLILDNVDCPRLLDPAQVVRLDSGDWLHVLATTRLGENELHGAHRDRSFLAIDELPPDDAVALIESYQPDGCFRSESERGEAREIVRFLGCFTLAVESAAVYLGQFATDVTCAAFLSRLKKEGLEGLDTAARQSSEGVLHGEKRLSATLQPTLERLNAAEKLALEFAALLPPDQVPLPWLRALVAKTFPEMERDAEPGYPDPWKNVLRCLFSLRLLRATDDLAADMQPRVVRIHRLVQDLILRGCPANETAGRSEALVSHITDRAFAIYKLNSAPDWELDAIQVSVPTLLRGEALSRDLANAAMYLTDMTLDYRGPGAAKLLLEATHSFFRRLAAVDSSNTQWQRDLSRCYQLMGDTLFAEGEIAEARRAFVASVEITKRLVADNPSNTRWQHDLSVSQDRLGEVLFLERDLEGSLGAYLDSMEVRQRLVETNPSNSDWQHALSESKRYIGDVSFERGDLTEAKCAYSASLFLIKRLHSDDPANANWQKSMSVIYRLLCKVLLCQRDMVGALEASEESLRLIQKLATIDPVNTNLQHLLSESYSTVGDVLLEKDDANGALQYYDDSLAIWRRLAEVDKSNEIWMAGLARSLWKVGGARFHSGDLAEAMVAYQESNAVWKCLSAKHPSEAHRQRDLCLSQQRVGDVLLAQGDLSGALSAYDNSLATIQKIAKVDPGNPDYQKDIGGLYESVGDVLRTQGDLTEALAVYRESLVVRQRLQAIDDSDVLNQEHLGESQLKVGDLLHAQGDLAGSLKAYGESLEVYQRLVETDVTNNLWQRGLNYSRIKVGDVFFDQGDLTGAFNAYRETQVASQRLADADPSNVNWQHDLSMGQERLGDVMRAECILLEALEFYRKSLRLRQTMVTTDPTNAGWRRDLSVSQEKVGEVLDTQGDYSGAINIYLDSLTLRLELVSTDLSNHEWKRESNKIQQKVDELFLKLGDQVGANESLVRRHLEILLRFSVTTGCPHPRLQAVIGTYVDLLAEMGRNQTEVQTQLNDIGKPYGIRFDSNN